MASGDRTQEERTLLIGDAVRQQKAVFRDEDDARTVEFEALINRRCP